MIADLGSGGSLFDGQSVAEWFPFSLSKTLDRMAAQFLFQLVSRRYQKGSIILTSNKSFGDWGEIFTDQVLAAALLDRLLHYSTTLNMRGQSYRLREKRKSGLFSELTEPHKEVTLSP